MSLSRIFHSIREAIMKLFHPGETQGGGPKLLLCPNEKEIQGTQTIGPDGGTLQIGEHTLILPKGAVQGDVRFSGTLLVDRFLKVRITANGEDSYKFIAPATLKLSFGKCPPSDPRRLRVYKIDPKTNVVIEDLGGEVNPRERTVTATLRGLTSYTLGEPI